MSTNFWETIEDPTYEFGNSAVIHQQILDGLRQMANDIDDLENNDKKLTSRTWVKDRLMAFRANDNTVARGYEFSGQNDFTGQINMKGANVNLDANSRLYMQSQSMIQTPNLTININELETLNNVTSNIQTQLDSKASTSSLTTGLALKQNTITDGSLNIAKTSGLQTALDTKATTSSLTSGLALKQDTIDSTHQIAKNCVTNLESDLTARPTLVNLQDGTLNLGIDTLTVNNIVATNQTIQYSEIQLSKYLK